MPLTWTSLSGAGRLARVRFQEEFKARLARGRQFAPSLVGLDRDVALRQVAENGYRAEVIPATAEAVTLDLDSRRIRLLLDERNVVVRTSAG